MEKADIVGEHHLIWPSRLNQWWHETNVPLVWEKDGSWWWNEFNKELEPLKEKFLIYPALWKIVLGKAPSLIFSGTGRFLGYIIKGGITCPLVETQDNNSMGFLPVDRGQWWDISPTKLSYNFCQFVYHRDTHCIGSVDLTRFGD